MQYVLGSTLTSEQGKSFNIHFTKEYHEFKFINGNRDINDGLVNRLKRSITANGYLMNPIFINEKQEIIDGQHRFMALRDLEKEIPFIILEGYNGKEMQILNQTGTNWKTGDFMEYWITKGTDDYRVLKEFQNKFPKFTLTACIYLLSKHKASESDNDELGNRYNVFNAGEWKIVNYERGTALAEFLYDRIFNHHEGWNSLNLIIAFLFIEWKYPQFDRESFSGKLASRQVMLKSGSKWYEYVEQIGKIYDSNKRGYDRLSMNATAPAKAKK